MRIGQVLLDLLDPTVKKRKDAIWNLKQFLIDHPEGTAQLIQRLGNTGEINIIGELLLDNDGETSMGAAMVLSLIIAQGYSDTVRNAIDVTNLLRPLQAEEDADATSRNTVIEGLNHLIQESENDQTALREAGLIPILFGMLPHQLPETAVEHRFCRTILITLKHLTLRNGSPSREGMQAFLTENGFPHLINFLRSIPNRSHAISTVAPHVLGIFVPSLPTQNNEEQSSRQRRRTDRGSSSSSLPSSIWQTTRQARRTEQTADRATETDSSLYKRQKR